MPHSPIPKIKKQIRKGIKLLLGSNRKTKNNKTKESMD